MSIQWIKRAAELNPPLLARQANDSRGILSSPLTAATKVQIVTAKAQPNTVLSETARTVSKKRQILDLIGKRSNLPLVESKPATLPKQRPSGFPLSWGKPERFTGCFEQSLPPDEPARPHRGDYKLIKECIL